MTSAIERQMLQSQIIDRIQQIQQLHPDMQQQYFANQLGRERHIFAKKVNESDEVYHAKVGEKEEEKQQHQQDHPQEQRSPEQTLDGQANSEQKQHDHIDIKV